MGFSLQCSTFFKPALIINHFLNIPPKNRLFPAPEILQLEPISLAADIWSLGVLAYVLLTGFSPFGGDTDQETLRNITTAPLDFPAELFEGVSEDAKAFIALCLDRDPL
jgi:serine/threonine-protein kinase GIN4